MLMRRRWIRRRLRENRWRWIYCWCRNKFVSPVDTAPRAEKILIQRTDEALGKFACPG